jgi:Sigma-70 region 2
MPLDRLPPSAIPPATMALVFQEQNKGHCPSTFWMRRELTNHGRRIPKAIGCVWRDMNSVEFPDGSGPFEARYLAFLETITNLRPSLHRYCSRMTWSVLDVEDVVPDALFEAYRKLDQYNERRPLKPWLFRIAHNRCIDLLHQCSGSS